jgi:SecD/SecF fusion protein
MSEVITRSLVTSLSTLLPITALMLFGGETLRDFGFALLIGVASGTYSSIFIAAPVLTHWKQREQVWRRRERIVMEDHDGVVPAYADTALGDEASRPARRERPAPARSRPAAQKREEPAVEATVVEEPPVAATPEPSSDGGNGGGGQMTRQEARRAARLAAQRQERASAPEAAADPEAKAEAERAAAKRAAANRRRRKHGRNR